MKMKLLPFVYLSGTAMILLCLCVSPLNDVDIDDFSLIGANMSISKYFGSASPAWETVHVSVYDKNYASVKIKNGGVSVNGTAMGYDSSALYLCYTEDNLAIVKNTGYQFVITLSNGAQCTSSVRTPAAEFGAATAPASFRLGQGATVTWTDVAQGSPVAVKLSIESTKDSANHIVIDDAGVPDSGRFVVPPIADTTLAGSATLELTRSAAGTVSSKLRSGSIGVTYMFSVKMTATK
ncbi:MAG TPA: hypothetical protein VLX68_12330 [Chitinivibrionales bacterium]|nr:hypothetical protein [Chitinivibrionales bacterium]